MRLRSALVAVQFLSCVPVRFERPPSEREVGLSLLWYPAVGLSLGVLLWTGSLLFRQLPGSLTAAMVLTLWVACTGALHLDGLADVADAWVGGLGNRERTLAIMKDPHAGPIAVVSIICLLLLKFGALAALQEPRVVASGSELRFASACLLPPVLARAAVVLLFAQTPYVRDKGLGADLARYQSRVGGRSVATLTALTAMGLGRYGLVATAVSALVYFLMRRAFIARLGGMTGDCAGAMIEVIEALGMVSVAVC
jgi:adenosylcobinamide-GDP ribazoletransferase